MNELILKYMMGIDQVFEKKKWKEKDDYERVFTSLVSVLEHIDLDDKKGELLIELLNRYEWLSLNDYYNKCKTLLENLILDLPRPACNVYLFPVIKKRHENSNKSGSFVIYLIKSIFFTLNKTKGINLQYFTNFAELSQKRFTKRDTFVLVDDFIGTGDTLNECISEISKIDKMLSDQLVLLTISIKRDTLSRVKSKFIKVYNSFSLEKGISDFYTKDIAEQKKDTMRSIESKLYPSMGSYSLGYKESESLISLVRTPDNTFPIFWRRYKKRIKVIPPFIRHE